MAGEGVCTGGFVLAAGVVERDDTIAQVDRAAAMRTATTTAAITRTRLRSRSCPLMVRVVVIGTSEVVVVVDWWCLVLLAGGRVRRTLERCARWPVGPCLHAPTMKEVSPRFP